MTEISETTANPKEPVEAELPPASRAYLVMSSGDRSTAAELLDAEGASPGDPVDVEAALAWDPALWITGGALAIVWICIATGVL